MMSEIGNGAILLTVPDAPLSLQENYSLRTKSELALDWTIGVENGGASV